MKGEDILDMIPLVDLKAQYLQIKEEIDRAISDVLESSRYIMGEKVSELESEIARFIGTRHAVSCANGTDALVLSLHACGIGEGDEVITSPLTFFATAEAISRVGAKPVFTDVHPDTFNIDAQQIERVITPRTKAIIPVHLYGQPADMDELNTIAEKYGLYIIEDACQAFGAGYKGKKAGSLGNAGCFSFFPSKNLGAYGDGGIITTNDDRIASEAASLRVHGSLMGMVHEIPAHFANTFPKDPGFDISKYFNRRIGYNSRLDELQAAILLVKLKHIDQWNDARRKIAGFYTENLRKTSLVVPKVPEYAQSVFYLYVLQSEKRSEMIRILKDKGISTGIHYPVPLHLQKAFESLGYRRGDFPVSERLSERIFSIPIYPELTAAQMEYIVQTLLNAVK
jgi:dTDP-4-amino-4,6-dideoxygalactose transaminase